VCGKRELKNGERNPIPVLSQNAWYGIRGGISKYYLTDCGLHMNLILWAPSFIQCNVRISTQIKTKKRATIRRGRVEIN
jgi:hypothetical protein